MERSDRGKDVQEYSHIFLKYHHYVSNFSRQTIRLKYFSEFEFLGCDFWHGSILRVFEINPHSGLGWFMLHLAPSDLFSSRLKERYKKKCQKHFSYSFNPCAH